MNGFEMILPFLKPIEHLILDDTISEVMVNGPTMSSSRGRDSFEQVHGLSLGEKSLMIAVKNIARRLGDDISRGEAHSRFAAAGWEPRCRRHSSVQFERGHIDHPKVQFAPFWYRRSRSEPGHSDAGLPTGSKDYVLARKNILISGGTGTWQNDDAQHPRKVHTSG